MKKEKIKLEEIMIVGLTTRTNNKNEMIPEKSKIGELAKIYWSKLVANNIKQRKSPGITYSIYTEYESDENGEYTYFIGEAVESFDGQDLNQFKTLVIPTSDYQKFTTHKGEMPTVVISSWQQLWKMSEADLGGQRTYIADFEIYDERAADPSQAIIDIYIGINDN